MKNSEEKQSFEDEINFIFKSVFQKNVTLKSKAIEKVRQVMKLNAEDLVREALKRAILRDANLSTLETCDLLYAIEKRGEIYKMKIGKNLTTTSSFGAFREKKIGENGGEDEIELDDEKDSNSEN